MILFKWIGTINDLDFGFFFVLPTILRKSTLTMNSGGLTMRLLSCQKPMSARIAHVIVVLTVSNFNVYNVLLAGTCAQN